MAGQEDQPLTTEPMTTNQRNTATNVSFLAKQSNESNMDQNEKASMLYDQRMRNTTTQLPRPSLKQAKGTQSPFSNDRRYSIKKVVNIGFD